MILELPDYTNKPVSTFPSNEDGPLTDPLSVSPSILPLTNAVTFLQSAVSVLRVHPPSSPPLTNRHLKLTQTQNLSSERLPSSYLMSVYFPLPTPDIPLGSHPTTPKFVSALGPSRDSSLTSNSLLLPLLGGISSY